jgi:hypothetical protein
MPGSLTSFIDTLQEKQPLRSAVRGLLGMPRRSSTLIDPMEEMIAREREMGGDVSDPMPAPTRRPAVMPTAAQQPLPAPAPATEPGSPGVLAPPSAVDERQPYKGMGMLEAMVTPHSMALDRQRQRARGQAESVGGAQGLATSIRAITDDPELPEIDKLKRLADITALAAIEATDNDQRKTLMRVSENYLRRATFRESADMGRQTTLDAMDKQRETLNLQRGLMQDQFASEQQLLNQGATNTERLNEQVARLEREAVSRGTAFADEIAPLAQDRSMPVELYARQMQAAAAARNREKGVPDPAGEAAAYENARLNGLRVRVGQHISDAIQTGSPLFDENHPGFTEFSIPYRARLMSAPQQYDQLRAELTSVIGPAIFEEVRKADIPFVEAARYVEGLTGAILGPKPESGGFFGQLMPF